MNKQQITQEEFDKKVEGIIQTDISSFICTKPMKEEHKQVVESVKITLKEKYEIK